MPDEKIEDVDMTLSVIRRMSRYIYLASMQSVRILPDAALYNIAKERNLLSPDFDWFKPYTNEVDSQASNSYYNTIPLYLEHLSQAEIIEKVFEFNMMAKANFAYLHSFNSTLAKSLKLQNLNKLTLSELRSKAGKAFVMLKSAYRNRNRKELKYFQ